LGGKTPLGRAAVSLYLLAGAGICPVQDSCGGEGLRPGDRCRTGRRRTGRRLLPRRIADIADVVHTHLNEEATMLVVEWFTPGHGLRRIDRD
jgi:hypothetical protein